MTTELDKLWRIFLSRVEERLKEGQIQYGNKSFTKNPDALLNELQQEVEDIAGWGVILWIRLEAMREQVRKMNSSE